MGFFQETLGLCQVKIMLADMVASRLGARPIAERTLVCLAPANPLIDQYETTLEHQQWLSQEVSRRCQTLAPIPLPFIPLGF